MKKITVFIETDASGTYNAYTNDELPFGLLGEGDTVEETIVDFYSAVEEMKALYAEEGKAFPAFELLFQYDTESFLKHYSQVFNMPALERLTGINQKQLHHYLTGQRKPREAQRKKIETALHQLGEDLLAIRL